jgi:hypothetical protein
MNNPQPQGPAPAGEPVVVCMGRALVGFDHATGAVVWHFVAEAAIQRIFRIGSRILATCGDSVACIEAASGRHVGTVNIGFTPDAGLVCGTDLVLADGTTSGTETPSVACISSDGQIRWRATRGTESAQQPGGWGTSPPGKGPGENVLRTYGADGQKRSEIRYPRSGYRAGILFGTVVAQPDRS